VEAKAGSSPEESESDLEEGRPVPKGRHPSEDDEQRSGASGSEPDMGTGDRFTLGQVLRRKLRLLSSTCGDPANNRSNTTLGSLYRVAAVEGASSKSS